MMSNSTPRSTISRRGHLVLDDLDAGTVAGGILPVLELGDLAHVDAYGGVELQGVTAGSGLGVAEHHADLLAQLVDEDTAGVGLRNVGGELSQGLAHQPGLQSHLLVSHLTLDLRLGCQGCYRVHYYNVNSPAADQVVGYLEGLLPTPRFFA